MTKNRDEASPCKICGEGEVAYNDLCTDCLAKALSGTQKPQVTSEEARRVLLAEQLARTQAAQQEVQQVLEKHKVAIDVAMLLRPNQVLPQIGFAPVEGWAGDPTGEAVTRHNF